MGSVNRHLIIQQLDRKITKIKEMEEVPVPPTGWVNALRTALRMPLRYLGGKMGISAQSVKEIEEREASGGITLNALRAAAEAMDMHLVYGLVPKEESLEKMIEKRAYEVAAKIVGRTSQSMALEDQENQPERLQKAIRETASEIKRTMPRYLWD